MDNPSKIIEDGTEYTLGVFDGKEVLYDFDKILIYLNAKGKLLFGKQFQIYDRDRDIVFKLCNYFINDKDFCNKENIDPTKGVLLTGPVGCGKTSLMKLIRHLVPKQRPYQVIPSRNITFSFNHLGYKTIEEFGKTKGKVKTHATTNLNAEELEELYGNRVRSRMRDIFNLIAFDKNTNDKRK